MNTESQTATKFAVTCIDKTGRDTHGKHWYIFIRETGEYIAEFRETKTDPYATARRATIACRALNNQE